MGIKKTKGLCMCGINGMINSQQQPSHEDVALVSQMNEMSYTRGPDSEGLLKRGQFVFGHTRLSIIDLSENSAQPLWDPYLRLGMVFNGEIYNYKQIKEELVGKGYEFFSDGDTEVLLKAYHCYGEDFVNKLNGMFAFCLWDQEKQKTILGRDRLGIKPLYYTTTNNKLYFSSYMPTLLEIPGRSWNVSPENLQYYLQFHSVVPEDKTIIDGIHKVKPGHIITFDKNFRVSEKKYWDLKAQRQSDYKHFQLKDWKELLHEKLVQSVDRRLVADVPVGVFLSGGLDSSLITALAAERVSDLNTFSVGFKGAKTEDGDEFVYSDMVAKKFNTKHHKLEVSTKELLENLDSVFVAMNEPMISHDNVGFYLLSKFASKQLKVVQSGQGADEVFAGYRWYPPMLEKGSGFDTYRENFFDRSPKEYKNMLNSNWFVDQDIAGDYVKSWFNSQDAESQLDKALKLDTQVMLVDDPVKRVDSMTMAWSLEARVPFLDHELVELAALMPENMKIGPNGEGKYILRELGYDLLPREVIDRPKGYFPVPELKYIGGPFLDYCKDIMNTQQAKERGIFTDDYVNTLMAAPQDFLTPLQCSKLWQIVSLEKWLQTHL